VLRRTFRIVASVTAGAGCLALGVPQAEADQVVLRSKAPYWEVGVNDPVLSQMCATGQFNEKNVNAYVARFTGNEGAAVLGIAKGNGLNLSDPKHAAKATEDYFFLGDGSSSCSVFVGGRKPPPKPGDKKPGTPNVSGNTPSANANPTVPMPTATPVAPAPPSPPTPPAGAPANGGP
jgi:hypothetical protein